MKQENNRQRLLNYKTFGGGDSSIIIIHGLFGSLRNWQQIALALSAKHYRTITVDLINHGMSSHSENMSYQDMAEDIIFLIEKLQLGRPPIIIGHSMGGKVAMIASMLQPKLLKGLIVVDIAPVKYKNEFSPLLKTINALNILEIKNRGQAEEIILKQIKEPNLVKFILQNLVKTEHGYKWRINLETITKNINEIVMFPDEFYSKQCTLPILFIAGMNSNYIQLEHHNIIYNMFPFAEIKGINDAGHWLHAERPDIFLKLIFSFINSI